MNLMTVAEGLVGFGSVPTSRLIAAEEDLVKAYKVEPCGSTGDKDTANNCNSLGKMNLPPYAPRP